MSEVERHMGHTRPTRESSIAMPSASPLYWNSGTPKNRLATRLTREASTASLSDSPNHTAAKYAVAITNAARNGQLELTLFTLWVTGESNCSAVECERYH